MEAGIKDLSKYRFEKAQKNVALADSLFGDGFYDCFKHNPHGVSTA